MRKKRPRPWRLAAPALLVGAVVLVRVLFVAPVHVSSTSMLPTLARGDVVLVSQGPGGLARRDLITFRSPEDGRRSLKRVVGLAGDVLVIRDSVLFVNERRVAEPYVDHGLIDGYYSRTFRVPPDTVFVLGDNRGNSIDSRDYGPVPLDRVEGKVLVKVWSLDWVGL